MLWLGICMLVLISHCGCQQQVTHSANPIGIGVDEYDRIFTAAVDVLRDCRFTVNRQDRRFGVITTYPLIASSVLEPWGGEGATFDAQMESTINYQRRTVRVTLEPRNDNTAGGDNDADVGDNDKDAVGGGNDIAVGSGANAYQMRIEVAVERLQIPQGELTSSAVSYVRFRSQAGSVGRIGELGDEQAFWRKVRRDSDMEQSLIHDILVRSKKARNSVKEIITEDG